MLAVESSPKTVLQLSTRQALVMLGTITCEQDQKVAKGVWNGVKQCASDTVLGMTQGARQDTNYLGKWLLQSPREVTP